MSNIRQLLVTDSCLKIMHNGKLAHKNLFQLFNIILTLFLDMQFWEWNLAVIMRRGHYSEVATNRG